MRRIGTTAIFIDGLERRGWAKKPKKLLFFYTFLCFFGEKQGESVGVFFAGVCWKLAVVIHGKSNIHLKVHNHSRKPRRKFDKTGQHHTKDAHSIVHRTVIPGKFVRKVIRHKWIPTAKRVVMQNLADRCVCVVSFFLLPLLLVVVLRLLLSLLLCAAHKSKDFWVSKMSSSKLKTPRPLASTRREDSSGKRKKTPKDSKTLLMSHSCGGASQTLAACLRAASQISQVGLWTVSRRTEQRRSPAVIEPKVTRFGKSGKLRTLESKAMSWLVWRSASLDSGDSGVLLKLAKIMVRNGIQSYMAIHSIVLKFNKSSKCQFKYRLSANNGCLQKRNPTTKSWQVYQVNTPFNMVQNGFGTLTVHVICRQYRTGFPKKESNLETKICLNTDLKLGAYSGVLTPAGHLTSNSTWLLERCQGSVQRKVKQTAALLVLRIPDSRQIPMSLGLSGTSPAKRPSLISSAGCASSPPATWNSPKLSKFFPKDSEWTVCLQKERLEET